MEIMCKHKAINLCADKATANDDWVFFTVYEIEMPIKS